jgi:hypothetical protein
MTDYTKSYYYVVNKYHHKIGLNQDIFNCNQNQLFDFMDSWRNRLHFTDLENLGRFYYNGDFIAVIKLCSDSIIYKYYDPENTGKNEWIADKYIITEFEPISLYWKNKIFYMKAIETHGSAIKYIKPQIESICLEAVKMNGYTIQYIDPQTESICLEAVKQTGHALQFVIQQTDQICNEAIGQNVDALQYVFHQTEAMCLKAIELDSCAFYHVKHQTDTLCFEAVKRNGYMLEYVIHQTEAICYEAIKQTNGHALKYVIHQTDAMRQEAVNKSRGFAKNSNLTSKL